MFEAFKVGVTIALTNQVSKGLSAIGRDLALNAKQIDKTRASYAKLGRDTIKMDLQFAQATRKVNAFNASMRQMKILTGAGLVTGAAGYAMLKPLGAATKAAEEYAHQLNILKMGGLTQVEMAESVGLAWKTAHEIMTSNPTGNLRNILDLKNITGSLAEAKQLLPIVTKIQAAMAASSESRISGHAQEIGFSMGKALDMIGAVKDQNELMKQAAMMSKVVVATQNRVTPAMFQSVFQYARQGKFDMSDEFKYEILPSLMLEAATGKGGGGGSKGVGPMIAAMYRVTNQGYINKKSLPEWASLGIVSPGTALKTTTSGTTVGPMKDAAGAASKPFQWVNEVLVPSIRAKYGQNITDQFIRAEINGLYRGNQLAASGAVEFFEKKTNFDRDQKIIRKAMNYEDAFKEAMKNDPNTARAAAAAQWETLQTLIGLRIIPILLPALHKLANGLNALSQWAERHPIRFNWLVYGFTALGAAMAFGGAVMLLRAGFMGLKLALGMGKGGLIGGVGRLLPLLLGPLGLVAAITAVGLAVYAWRKEILDFIDSFDFGKKLHEEISEGGLKGKRAPWLTPEFSVVPPKGSGNGTVIVKNYMDGRQIGTGVAHVFNKEASRPAASSQMFNIGMTPAQAGGMIKVF